LIYATPTHSLSCVSFVGEVRTLSAWPLRSRTKSDAYSVHSTLPMPRSAERLKQRHSSFVFSTHHHARMATVVPPRSREQVPDRSGHRMVPGWRDQYLICPTQIIAYHSVAHETYHSMISQDQCSGGSCHRARSWVPRTGGMADRIRTK